VVLALLKLMESIGRVEILGSHVYSLV